MKKWNGWGNENSELTMELSDDLRAVLSARIGEPKRLDQISYEQALGLVPESRLQAHSLIKLDADSRLRHARGQSLPDWFDMRSGNIEFFPDGVAYPTSGEEVRELLQYADIHDVSVIPYGGGTSVLGHINTEQSDRAILTIDMGRMDKLMHLDRESQIATFGAGTPGPLVESQLNKEGFTLGHFPQSWELSTVGGWVASRSSGQQSLHYGRIEKMFAGGRVETLAGTLDIPTVPASSAGPDIREMILGSEGRMGILTDVKVRVSALPDKEHFQVVFFPSWESGMTGARQLAQQNVQLSMVRLSNPMETFSLMRLGGGGDVELLENKLLQQGIGEGKVMMTFGVTGSESQCDFAHQLAMQICNDHGGVADGVGLGDNWAHGRFRAPYLRDPLGEAGYAVDTMETAVDWSSVTDTMQKVEKSIAEALADEGEKVHVYTHLSHVYGQGSSIYTTYLFRFSDSFDTTMERWRKLKTAGAKQTVACGGTISHQHGVGADHRMYLEAEKGRLGIEAIRSLCAVFDPKGQMNPGKLLPDAVDKD